MKSNNKLILTLSIIVTFLILIGYLIVSSGINLGSVLKPHSGLALSSILMISFILGILHGATPDEHTWPITFSYAIGSYSTKGGMKSGLAFSTGFTLQRAFLTTIGFLGLATIYQTYNLDGPVYVIVGLVMAISGAYILNKKQYIHIPIDVLFKGAKLHSSEAEMTLSKSTKPKPVPLKMAVIHGLIAGFGFGAYSTIIVFILAPEVPGLLYAPLPGLFFGIGTMIMQIIFGAIFANIARLKKLDEGRVSQIGRKTAGRTLYYGGMLFAIIGFLIVIFPVLDSIAISTGNPIPNLDSIGVATILVLLVVGGVGIGSFIKGLGEMTHAD